MVGRQKFVLNAINPGCFPSSIARRFGNFDHYESNSDDELEGLSGKQARYDPEVHRTSILQDGLSLGGSFREDTHCIYNGTAGWDHFGTRFEWIVGAHRRPQ